MAVYSHPDGGRYHLVEHGRMKHPETGEWINAVAYRDVDPEVGSCLYMTSLRRWREKFTLVAETDG